MWKTDTAKYEGMCVRAYPDALYGRYGVCPSDDASEKNMIRCFQYINRKAWDYVQDELKASGTRPGPGQQTYGCDVPDDMCYQWAEDYFRDPDAKEDHEDEEKFVPKPYAGKSSAKSKPKKAAEKKKTEPKAAPKQEEKKPSQDGQMSLLDFGMAKAG